MEPFGTFTHAFDHVGVIGTYVDLDRHRQRIARGSSFRGDLRGCPRKGYEKLFGYVRADNEAGLKAYT